MGRCLIQSSRFKYLYELGIGKAVLSLVADQRAAMDEPDERLIEYLKFHGIQVLHYHMHG